MKTNCTSRVPSSALPLAFTLSITLVTIIQAQRVPALDPSFAPALTRPGGFGSAVAVQSDGKLLVAGGFNAVNGLTRNALVRLQTDGSVDGSFNPGAICCGFNPGGGLDALAPVTALAVQSDGRIVIGGTFTNVQGTARNGLARLNSTGSLDNTFNPGAGLTSSSFSSALLPVVSLLLQPDGKILVGGYFTAVDGVSRAGLARVNSNGTLDTGFDPGTALSIGFPDFGPLTGLALLANGQVLVAGAFQAFSDVKRPGLARLNADGSFDHKYDPGVYLLGAPPSLSGMVLQDDGHIVISGNFGGVDNELRSGLARLNPDGTPDLAFNPPVDRSVETYTMLLALPGGKTVAYREFTDSNGDNHRAIVRLNVDGTIDSAFNLELSSGENSRLQVRGVERQADGKLLIVGNFTLPGENEARGVGRVSAAGQADSSFVPKLELAENFNANVLTTAVQSDNKLLVGGAFQLVNGRALRYLARFNLDGTVDSSFAPNIASDQVQGYVASLGLQPDGKILLGGLFSTVQGASRNGVARLNADGTVDASFDPGSGTLDPEGGLGAVNAIAIQPDGRVLLAGSFTTLNNQPIPWMGRLNADGSPDLSFSSGVGACFTCDPPDIRSVAVLTNGLIMVSGVFNRVEAFFINGVTRLQTNGTVDLALMPTIKTEESVTAMAVDEAGRTTVAVGFSEAEGDRTRFLRFNPDATVDSTFQPDTIAGDTSAGPLVSAITIDGQGRLLMAGTFARVGSVPRTGLARLNANGTLDTGFDLGAGFGHGAFLPARGFGSLVTTLAVQNDGAVVAGGNFGTVDQEVRLGVVRLRSDQSFPNEGSPPRLQDVSRVTAGSVSMLLSGEAGKIYRIEGSSDLRTWSALGTVMGAATPQPFSDTGASLMPQRFYRATTP